MLKKQILQVGIWEVKERIATLKYLIFPFSFYFSMFILYLGNLSFFMFSENISVWLQGNHIPMKFLLISHLLYTAVKL